MTEYRRCVTMVQVVQVEQWMCCAEATGACGGSRVSARAESGKSSHDVLAGCEVVQAPARLVRVRLEIGCVVLAGVVRRDYRLGICSEWQQSRAKVTNTRKNKALNLRCEGK